MRTAIAVAGAVVALSLTTMPVPAFALTPIGPAAASASAEDVPFYVVQPAVNGEPEFLFAIAQRFLGDGERFREIFALNEGRVQPDGLAMTDPAVLNPGWILQMPPDARGDGLQMGPPISDFQPDSPLPPATSEGTNPGGGTDAGESIPAERPGAAASDAAVAPATVALIGGLIAAALVALAAAAFLVLRMRRRRTSAARGVTLRADRSSSWIVDSALKILVAACAREGVRFPGLYMVTVDDGAVHLLLTAPAATAPIGWTASADGRTWTTSLAHLQSQPVPPGTDSSFSRLVSLGMTASGGVLLDFSRAGGPVSIDGPAAEVDEVIDAWVAELTTSPWSDPNQRVVRAGGREENAERSVDSLLARLEQEGSGIVVLESTPSRAQAEVLRSLFGSPDFSWVVLVKGGFSAALWRFTVRDGLLTSGLLPDVRYAATRSAPEPARS